MEQVPVTLILFAAAKEALGCGSIDSSFDSLITGENLRKALLEKHPQLKHVGAFEISVNNTVCNPNDRIELRRGDEICVICAISGG